MHRDLKPENILLSDSNQAVISDLGFSTIQHEQVKKYPYVVGSPGYLAPEALEQAKFGVKSDIWALGVLTYVMLTGKTPWKGKNTKNLLQKLKTVPITTFIEGRNFGILSKFLIRALDVDIKTRMNVSQLADFLQ